MVTEKEAPDIGFDSQRVKTVVKEVEKGDVSVAISRI
jgi:hypothetical protein